MQVVTGTEEVTASVDDGLLVVVLNRPEVRNALSLAMLEGLASVLEAAAERREVRALVLSGAGGAFCAGGDVAMMAAGRSIFGAAEDPVGRAAVQADLQRRTVVRLRDLGKPTVAMITGPAVGAGLALALACDVRYAARSAVLMSGFGRVGLAGDFGCSWLLHDLVGRSVARELLFSSEAVAADLAQERGLVNGVHPDDDLEEQTLRAARRFARVSEPAAAVMLETSALSPSLSFADACDRDAVEHVRLTGTPEHRALVQALAGRGRAGKRAAR
ncbi:enoyl-CoA hydratase/isomerase family protein [Mumia sp. DW29H23]|uniref:enoyl-CoA hydratase/isomerase family protein n=1 Tax=Mumia sp. DW29H23 TaxID=3421241 RepID=UPI003D68AA41